MFLCPFLPQFFNLLWTLHYVPLTKKLTNISHMLMKRLFVSFFGGGVYNSYLIFCALHSRSLVRLQTQLLKNWKGEHFLAFIWDPKLVEPIGAGAACSKDLRM